MEKTDSGTEKEKGGEGIMLKEITETKGVRFIRIKNPTESDNKYSFILLQNPNNIKQSDLRDNMSLFECDEKGIWHEILRSAKLEREYQAWQEETRKNEEEQKCKERLAALEHKRWVLWSKHIAQTAIIPKEQLEYWIKMWIPYNQLTEEQKEYSRAWAEQIIKAMSKQGTALTNPTII